MTTNQTTIDLLHESYAGALAARERLQAALTAHYRAITKANRIEPTRPGEVGGQAEWTPEQTAATNALRDALAAVDDAAATVAYRILVAQGHDHDTALASVTDPEDDGTGLASPVRPTPAAVDILRGLTR